MVWNSSFDIETLSKNISDHAICWDCWQENPIHKSKLQLQGPHTGKSILKQILQMIIQVNTMERSGSSDLQHWFERLLSSPLPIDASVDHIQVELALWLFEATSLYHLAALQPGQQASANSIDSATLKNIVKLPNIKSVRLQIPIIARIPNYMIPIHTLWYRGNVSFFNLKNDSWLIWLRASKVATAPAVDVVHWNFVTTWKLDQNLNEWQVEDKNHVSQVNKMQFEERVDGDTEGRMFRVKSTDPRGPSLTYVCQAEDAQTRARCCLIGPF